MEKKKEIFGKVANILENWNWLEPIITHRSTFGGHICLEFAMFEFSIEYFDTQAVYWGKMLITDKEVLEFPMGNNREIVKL